ncbi:hypothetical protein ACI65C_005138 [Semiaphis heraclei]
MEKTTGNISTPSTIIGTFQTDNASNVPEEDSFAQINDSLDNINTTTPEPTNSSKPKNKKPKVTIFQQSLLEVMKNLPMIKNKEILARNVSKTLSSQSESGNSDQSANDESDDSYTKTKVAGRRRKPKKQFSPEQSQKRRKVIESSSIPPIPVPPKIPINSSVFIESSSNNDDVISNKLSYHNIVQCEGKGKMYKENDNGHNNNSFNDNDLLSEITINSFLSSVSANDFVLEDDNNMSVEIQTQEMTIIQPNSNYVSAPVTPEIENENEVNDSRHSTNDIAELKKMIEEQTNEFEKRDENVILQLLMLVRSNSKICEAVQNIDKKVGYMMKADTRTRSL